jgi:hypothetical protein
VWARRKDVVTLLRNAGLRNLYFTTNIVSKIISRGMMCAGHVARMEGTEKHTRFWSTIMYVSDHSYSYQSNVEVHSTALTAVPGPMSGSNRHVILHGFMVALPVSLPGCSSTSYVTNFSKKN